MAGVFQKFVRIVTGSGEISATNPLPVGTTGDQVTTGTLSSVNSSASTGQLLAANTARKGLILVNTDANALYLKYGTTATTAGGGYTVIISANGYWEMPLPIYTGRIDGIWAADGSGLAEITEL